MDVTVYQPQYQVLVYKTVKRDTVDGTTPTSARFSGTSSVIDLSPFLGDGSSISTRKSVNEPAGGFSITLLDRPYDNGNGLDSLYGLIEPMDLVEIRWRHKPEAYPGDRLPLVMRGFVSVVARGEGMTPDGRPIRNVTISGQDYGKLWQMIQIFYGPNYIIGQDILSGFKLLDKFNVPNAISNVDFVNIAIDQIINPFLKNLLPQGSEFPSITVKADSVRKGATGIAGIQTQEGSIYNLLRSYMDIGPFNELFLTEDDNGVYCVYRQNPALGLDGQPLDPETTKAPYSGKLIVEASELRLVRVPAKDIVSIEVARSDSGVANYYWVSPAGFLLNSDVYARQQGYSAEERKTIDQSTYPNSAEKLYGMRMMWVDTKLGGPTVSNVKSGLPAAEHAKRDAAINDWTRQRREFLVAQNKDNSILESGQLRIAGDQNIRAGNYISVVRGTIESLYYVTSVSHQVLPFRGVYTTLTVERGMGFANRIKLNGGVSSPYLSELVDRKRTLL